MGDWDTKKVGRAIGRLRSKRRRSSEDDRAAEGLVANDVAALQGKEANLREQIEEDEQLLDAVQQLDLTDRDFESVLRGLYGQVGVRFEAPNPQGLTAVSETLNAAKPAITYKIDDWTDQRVTSVEVSRNQDKLAAAFKAIYGTQAEIKSEADFQSEFLIAKGKAQAFLGVQADGSASAERDWQQLAVKANTNLFAGLRLHCDGEGVIGSADNRLVARIDGECTVGVELAASGSVTLSSQEISALLELSAFAGAKVEAKGKFTASVFGRELFNQGLTANASAGIGADLKASFKAGVDSVSFEFQAGVTVGLGAGAGTETTVNLSNVKMTLTEAKDRIARADTYLDGYRSLNIQEKEWELRVEVLEKTLTQRIEANQAALEDAIHRQR
ncbi:MAG: hypothetical protein AAGJ46_19300 [Planctomycetota bacterium]